MHHDIAAAGKLTRLVQRLRAHGLRRLADRALEGELVDVAEQLLERLTPQLLADLAAEDAALAGCGRCGRAWSAHSVPQIAACIETAAASVLGRDTVELLERRGAE